MHYCAFTVDCSDAHPISKTLAADYSNGSNNHNRLGKILSPGLQGGLPLSTGQGWPGWVPTAQAIGRYPRLIRGPGDVANVGNIIFPPSCGIVGPSAATHSIVPEDARPWG